MISWSRKSLPFALFRGPDTAQHRADVACARMPKLLISSPEDYLKVARALVPPGPHEPATFLNHGLDEARPLCQLPRWGYVLKGKTSFQLAGREESYEAGDAYYVPPGHIPVHHVGAEIIEFSPTDVLGATMAAVMRNMSHGNIA